MNAAAGRPLAIGTCVLVLGLAGFAAGFFGPMLLNPDANQGPMTGIFLTGPGGAVLGLVLGVALRLAPVGTGMQRRILVFTSVVFVTATLYFCLPEPELYGTLLEGDASECEPPVALEHAAVDEWNRRIQAAPWAQPRKGWQQEVHGLVRDATGVVLQVDVRRTNRVLRHRKPWDANRLSIEGWRNAADHERYFAEFAGTRCNDYRGPLPLLYVQAGQGSSAWPADDLPNFLGVAKADPVPDGIRRLMQP